MNHLRIFSGSANPELARKVCTVLDVELGKSLITTFSDGEIRVEINENVRGTDVFIIQSTCPPVNDNLMELLVIIDAAKRASAKSITVVTPYFGYARQDRKVKPRTPITAKLVANLITTAGAHRVVTIDLHAGQIQGFFDLPMDNLFGRKIFTPENSSVAGMIADDPSGFVIVSPDAGGMERARALAKQFSSATAVAMIDKRREGPNRSEVMNIVGNISGKKVLLFDDMVDTGGTTANAANALKANGAMEVYSMCIHPVLSGQAVSKIENSPIIKQIVTDTIPLNQKAYQSEKFEVLSVSKLLGEAIKRIHTNESVSGLFDEPE